MILGGAFPGYALNRLNTSLIDDDVLALVEPFGLGLYRWRYG